MVSSFLWRLATIALVCLTSQVFAQVPTDLQQGQYWLPPRDQVSANPRANTPFRRSPCPALNSLMNHGFLPRDGLRVNIEAIVTAAMQVYNMDVNFLRQQVAGLPRTFDMNMLGTHNLIEHDASLFRDDLVFGQDPIRINGNLVDNFVALAQNGRIGVNEMIAYRTQREANSRAQNPQYTLDGNSALLQITYQEAALVLLVLGDTASQSISVESARSFFAQERIPDNYTRPATTVPAMTIESLSLAMFAQVPKAVQQGQFLGHGHGHGRGRKGHKGRKGRNLRPEPEPTAQEA